MGVTSPLYSGIRHANESRDVQAFREVVAGCCSNIPRGKCNIDLNALIIKIQKQMFEISDIRHTGKCVLFVVEVFFYANTFLL